MVEFLNYGWFFDDQGNEVYQVSHMGGFIQGGEGPTRIDLVKSFLYYKKKIGSIVIDCSDWYTIKKSHWLL